ncbi:hypothetical protein O6379_24140, partial [Salmonella enterica subsp. enterica]|nr:hypothetical protein [Salmonella enterica]
WNSWLAWNGVNTHGDFGMIWMALLPPLPELDVHAMKWQSRILNGKELVKEVLTWHGSQTLTLKEKPDL